MDSTVIAAIIGPVLTALLGLLAYIAMKVHKHDVADQKLKTEVKAVKKDMKRVNKRLDGVEDSLLALNGKMDQMLEKAA